MCTLGAGTPFTLLSVRAHVLIITLPIREQSIPELIMKSWLDDQFR